MEQPIMGQIQLFPYKWEMYDWMTCQGQTLNINQNQTLFSLLGFTYGGNGSTTFALPNLRGTEPLPAMAYYICTSGYYPQRQ